MIRAFTQVSLSPSPPCQRAKLQIETEPHLAIFVDVVFVSRLGIHVSDGVEQELRDLDALLPRKRGCDVEWGQRLQLRRKCGESETQSAARQVRPWFGVCQGPCCLSRGEDAYLSATVSSFHNTISSPGPWAQDAETQEGRHRQMPTNNG